MILFYDIRIECLQNLTEMHKKIVLAEKEYAKAPFGKINDTLRCLVDLRKEYRKEFVRCRFYIDGE